jgi:hypothetical protein
MTTQSFPYTIPTRITRAEVGILINATHAQLEVLRQQGSNSGSATEWLLAPEVLRCIKRIQKLSALLDRFPEGAPQ